MGMLVLLAYPATPDVYWSPYYRIDLRKGETLAGEARPHYYVLDVNHQYHQKMVDLSSTFQTKHPDAEPNRSAVLNYELPYWLVPTPESVLIVGAGTGNDVAAALRHGAKHIDAVEIDPLIYNLGKRYHPERPYDSERVSVHIDDARAFFRKTDRRYDLIVFAYLDAHTMLSSFSSLGLDNYVYTLESVRDARALLAAGGTLTLAFDSGETYVDQRLYGILKQVFNGVGPHVYRTEYDGEGLLYVSGEARKQPPTATAKEVGASLEAANVILPTDRWPFLYLARRSIPFAMLVVVVAFLIGARRLLRAARLTGTILQDRLCQLSLLLGGGFLLLETKGVTEASLLFGSTWMTNAVVIAGFLLMAMMANFIVALRPIAMKAAFAGLFPALVINIFVPYSALAWLDAVPKIIMTALLVGLPVFFTGLAFSELYRRAPDPAAVLGANLLGAVLGGALENMVMIGGTPLLGGLVFLLYGLAAWRSFNVNGWRERAAMARVQSSTAL
jgi:spermidine synthase